MLISSAQGYARVWDTTTWREEATLRGFLNAVSSAAFSPDQRRLVLDGNNPEDRVRLWDTESWQEVLTLPRRNRRKRLGSMLRHYYRPAA